MKRYFPSYFLILNCVCTFLYPARLKMPILSVRETFKERRMAGVESHRTLNRKILLLTLNSEQLHMYFTWKRTISENNNKSGESLYTAHASQ